MTIPTTSKAITETPANTPKPIGNTSNFFPGGSKGAAAPAFSGLAVGDVAEDDELEDSGKDKGVDEGGATVGESVLSGCGVATGFGTDEGAPLLVLVSLGGDTAELVTSGRGTEVSVIETTGGGTDPELVGGNSVMVESGGTVLEGTPVLSGRLMLESPSVVLDETPPSGGRVLVLVGGATVDVDESESLELVDVAGGTALESPSSGMTTQVLSSLTMSTPFTTIGVRVIIHVWMNVPTSVVIFSVVVTVTEDVRVVSSCLENTVDVRE